MIQWQKYEEDFFLLVEAGFIAVNQGDEDSSLKLFRAAEMLKPDHSLPKVGFGYIHFHKLELKQACHYFQKVLETQPDNEMANAFLGLAMALSPDMITKGEVLLEKAAHSKDSNIQNLGSSALKFVEDFIKKAPIHMTPPPESHQKKKKAP